MISGNWFSLSCHLLLNHFKHDARAQVFDAVRWWIILGATGFVVLGFVLYLVVQGRRRKRAGGEEA